MHRSQYFNPCQSEEIPQRFPARPWKPWSSSRQGLKLQQPWKICRVFVGRGSLASALPRSEAQLLILPSVPKPQLGRTPPCSRLLLGQKERKSNRLLSLGTIKASTVQIERKKKKRYAQVSSPVSALRTQGSTFPTLSLQNRQKSIRNCHDFWTIQVPTRKTRHFIKWKARSWIKYVFLKH